jgi:2-phospho-L-lactate guanylyltransferase
VKRLAEAKSRLAPRLAPDERADLALDLLRRVVDALRSARPIERIALVTPEPELGRRFGVETIADRGGLNPSLVAGVRWAEGADGLLILPADLPLIRSEHVEELLEQRRAADVVIAPTHDGGTGALLLQPPAVLPPAFGPNSYRRHLDLAGERGLLVQTFKSEGFAFDLDTPQDLKRLAAAR